MCSTTTLLTTLTQSQNETVRVAKQWALYRGIIADREGKGGPAEQTFLIPDIDCSLPTGNPSSFLAGEGGSGGRGEGSVVGARAACIAGHYFYSVSFEPTLAPHGFNTDAIDFFPSGSPALEPLDFSFHPCRPLAKPNTQPSPPRFPLVLFLGKFLPILLLFIIIITRLRYTQIFLLEFVIINYSFFFYVRFITVVNKLSPQFANKLI